jgi:hypothetical protein
MELEAAEANKLERAGGAGVTTYRQYVEPALAQTRHFDTQRAVRVLRILAGNMQCPGSIARADDAAVYKVATKKTAPTE